jgi:DNA (cytosine-5)-methyltransferase 1
MEPILTHGSLFSGIGGFDLAAEWMGWENLFHCEWNPFGQRVLKHYWPNAESFHDIKKSNFTHYANRIDVLTGGFPCQPYSSAGKRLGKEDERHLWPEMLRVISEVSPRFVVGENVRGITNWNGGVVFDEVCTDLENLGYQVAPVIIPACGVNAPHRRERVWFVAKNAMRGRCLCREFNEERTGFWQQRNTGTGGSNGICLSKGLTANAQGKQGERLQLEQRKVSEPQSREFGGSNSWMGSNWDAANANGQRHEKLNVATEPSEPERQHSEKNFGSEPGCWDNFPTKSPICGRNDGVPGGLDGITFSKWRNESVKAYGNAIVPQVAYQIFKAIEAAAAEYENIVSL